MRVRITLIAEAPQDKWPQVKYLRIMEQKHEGHEGKVPKGPRPEGARSPY